MDLMVHSEDPTDPMVLVDRVLLMHLTDLMDQKDPMDLVDLCLLDQMDQLDLEDHQSLL
jgi:hypothetical protein